MNHRRGFEIIWAFAALGFGMAISFDQFIPDLGAFASLISRFSIGVTMGSALGLMFYVGGISFVDAFVSRLQKLKANSKKGQFNGSDSTDRKNS